MKVIQSNNLDNRKVLVEFYELDNYGGESVKLDAGEYNRDQIPLKGPLLYSIRVVRLRLRLVI